MDKLRKIFGRAAHDHLVFNGPVPGTSFSGGLASCTSFSGGWVGRWCVVALLVWLVGGVGAMASDRSVPLTALFPAEGQGVSWGVPFLKGEIDTDTRFYLVGQDGRPQAVQQWTMASWSDGSPKWVGFAAVPADMTQPLSLLPLSRSEARRLSRGESRGAADLAGQAACVVAVREDASSVTVGNGCMEVVFPKSGRSVVESIRFGEKTVASGGRLLLQMEDRSRLSEKTLLYRDYVSQVEKVTVEQAGPVRAVVKVEGRHVCADAQIVDDQYADGSSMMAGEAPSRAYLPFVLRFYIYAGVNPVQLVHSFLFDGEQQSDFIKALGLHFDIPFRQPVYNRHIAFTGDLRESALAHTPLGDLRGCDPQGERVGVWHEPVQPLVGRRVLRETRSTAERVQDFPMKRPEDRRPQAIEKERAQLQRYGRPSGPTVYHRQMAFETIADRSAFDPSGQALIDDWAVWNDFKLSQLSCDGFSIQKRTGSQAPWIFSDGGERATGFVLAGDVTGGLGVSLKDFWQSYPTALEVHDAASDEAGLDVWLWSPDAPAMDLRHYDTIPHGLNAAYEDVQEGLSTPYGIARTHSLTLYPFDALPLTGADAGTVAAESRADSLASATLETISAWALAGLQPPHLFCTPAYYHAAKAFGAHWSLPYLGWADTEEAALKAGVSDTVCWVEAQLDKLLAFYMQAVDDNRWYGFWNYGDFMHSYDSERHAWMYDVGGFAWDNTELAPEMWLWYSFLRTGRADVFRLAEALSRHTAEVDVYHEGELKGLGSRHNVSHWGCGAKEARIGQAAWKRFYAYLTTDERMGDLMHEVTDADYTTLEWDPLRIAKPRSRFPSSAPARLRWGPDWTSFATNWFIEWERTGHRKYLDKLLTGMTCLADLPAGCFTGQGPLGYFPETGRIIYEGPEGATDATLHLATIMGGFETFAEMLDDVDHPAFRQCWYNYCLYYSMSPDDPRRSQETASWGPVMSFNTPRLTAYAAWQSQDAALKARAWREFLRGRTNPYFDIEQRPIMQDIYASHLLEAPEVLHPRWEIPSVGTNGSAQWSLNAIFLMGLLGTE